MSFPPTKAFGDTEQIAWGEKTIVALALCFFIHRLGCQKHFAWLYPLNQKDMVPALKPVDLGLPIPSKVEVETSARDYTPPQYLTLLFTDLVVLTPSIVSDEQIQLYL